MKVLFDALAVKNMPAFCLDGVFRNIVAQSAHSGLPFSFSELASIVLAADYEIGVASHLAHTRNQAKDI